MIKIYYYSEEIDYWFQVFKSDFRYSHGFSKYSSASSLSKYHRSKHFKNDKINCSVQIREYPSVAFEVY